MEREALALGYGDYQTYGVYIEAGKEGQRFMGSLIEWLLNTCYNLRRLSISEGGNDKFKK